MKIIEDSTIFIIEENDFIEPRPMCGTSVNYILIPTSLYDKWVGSELAISLIMCLKPHGLILKI